jgi:hypothetical protein
MASMNERKMRALVALLAEFQEDGHGDEEHVRKTGVSAQEALRNSQAKIRDNRYATDLVSGRFHRQLLLVETLSEDPLGDRDLADLGTEIDTGAASGEVETLVNEQVPPALMAGLLLEQRSDPEFLLHEEDTTEEGA